MPLYTFYPCKRGGLSETFASYELPSDDDALQYAGFMLEEHRSATEVVIWCGDRRVSSVGRDHERPHAQRSPSREGEGAAG